MPRTPSLPRIAITATGSTAAELLEAARRALRYTRFIELRLDWVPNPDTALAELPALFREFSEPRKRPILIATCRREPNGGRFRGAVAEQFAILEAAAAAGCRLVDLEIESAETSGRAAVAALRARAMLVLSFHDFERTPKLLPVARRLLRFPADFYKLVGTAKSQTDNCSILAFVESIPAQMSLSSTGNKEAGWIAFCMGEAGVPSRILALSRGSAFVYAALPLEAARANRGHDLNNLAAPGQLDWNILKRRYIADKLTRGTAIYGLVGSPVGQSIGAAIHNAAFRARRADAVYIPFLVEDLRDFQAAADHYPVAGFSVTIPHKQAVLRAAERVDRLARAAGAVNTVRIRRTNKDGRWEATNTDVQGIIAPLRRSFRLGRLGERRPLAEGFRAAILGNGGAARAAVLALKELRCGSIAVTGRNPAKVRQFARELEVDALPIEQLERERFDLLVQTTPVGMWPRTDECPLRTEQINAATVFDLIYNPPTTRLLELAAAKGCRTISGLEMFLEQAAGQFRYWTGLEPPVALMRRVAVEELGRAKIGDKKMRRPEVEKA